MNKQQFLEKYEKEKPFLNAWGSILATGICTDLAEMGYDMSAFLKIPVDPRIKDNSSIVAKAFFRKDKHYENPYEQITDKVGIRFVVLDICDIAKIKTAIESHMEWDFSLDVDYEKSRATKPELFEYQSVHYIVRNRVEIKYGGVILYPGIPCEVQIRTLLQHAYAELSHQTVYKSAELIDPTIRRKLARSIALIEATDELFKEVRSNMRVLDSLLLKYISAAKRIGCFPNYVETLNATIFDVYKDFISEENISPEKVTGYLDSKKYIVQKVSENTYDSLIYEQPIIYLLYYMADNFKDSTLDMWPFDRCYIEPIYVDLGIAI